ncbi:unannotated protein [freshwater metagenome]|uniref:Unannotated protein n=1 Tax=freshwater metagenome TaxID=449393 RepID=A0A6J6PT10_9ZZZZ
MSATVFMPMTLWPWTNGKWYDSANASRAFFQLTLDVNSRSVK